MSRVAWGGAGLAPSAPATTTSAAAVASSVPGSGTTLADRVAQGKSFKPSASSAAASSSATAAPAAKPALEAVRVDGLVLLKIIKHCTESLPQLCSGSLLGMDGASADQQPQLEVTNCFPFPPGAVEEEGGDDAEVSEASEFQVNMLKMLRDVNVDCNQVGWYRSTYMGSFCTPELVQQLFNYQEELDDVTVRRSVVLLYDHFQTRKGNLCIKAFRLSDAFSTLLRERKLTAAASAGGGARGARRGAAVVSAAVAAAVGGLRGDGSAIVAPSEDDVAAESILEEVPVVVTNAHLFTVLLSDLGAREGRRLDTSFDRLTTRTNPYLEKNLEFLVEEVENLGKELNDRARAKRAKNETEERQVQWITQRRAENRAREERGEALLPEDGDARLDLFKPPNALQQQQALEGLLIRKQMSIYCDQVNKFSGAGFSKLYLAGAVQRGLEARSE